MSNTLDSSGVNPSGYALGIYPEPSHVLPVNTHLGVVYPLHIYMYTCTFYCAVTICKVLGKLVSVRLVIQKRMFLILIAALFPVHLRTVFILQWFL